MDIYLGPHKTSMIKLFLKKVIFDRATARKMKFPIKDFSSKCDQIRSFLRIWLHLLKKSLMENFIFCAVGPLLLAHRNFLIEALALCARQYTHHESIA